MLNRAIQAQQAPGSTFKPIVALAGARKPGPSTTSSPCTAPAASRFTATITIAASKSGHGTVSLHNGIVHSCDVYFYTVGNKTGDRQHRLYADMVGFRAQDRHRSAGRSGGRGALDAVEAAHATARNGTPERRISVAIGQGALTVTPMQLARAIGGLAMGGVWHRPHLVKAGASRTSRSSGRSNPDNVKDVVDGMYGVVNEGGAPGVRARMPGIEVCGKTGYGAAGLQRVTSRRTGRHART